MVGQGDFRRATCPNDTVCAEAAPCLSTGSDFKLRHYPMPEVLEISPRIGWTTRRSRSSRSTAASKALVFPAHRGAGAHQLPLGQPSRTLWRRACAVRVAPDNGQTNLGCAS